MCLNAGLHANGAPTKVGAPFILDKKAERLSKLIREIANRPALATPATSVPDPVASAKTIIKPIINTNTGNTVIIEIIIEIVVKIVIEIIIAAMISTPHKVHLLS